MRLVLVVPRFPRLSETFIANKFAGLVDAGWDVHVVCQQASLGDWAKFPALAARPDLQSRVHVQRAHASRLAVAIMWLPVLLATAIRAPQATWRYWREAWRTLGFGAFKRFYLDAAIIALAPDIVHFEFGAGAVGRTHLKKCLGCYLTASFRGYDLAYAGVQYPDYYADLWANADAIHLLGEDLWQRALARGCPPDMPHALIPPAIDVDLFAGEETSHGGNGVDDGRPLRIVSVGRLDWVKGYEYGLEALRLLREEGVTLEYHIVGSGDYLEPLAFARHQLGLDGEVTFMGGQPQAVVLDEMRWADVFLHAAVSEGFCNVVLEAQAMGLPVVCSDAGGLKENVVNGETGYIVPRRDPAALATRLAELAHDPRKRAVMGRAGRRRVEQCFQLADQIKAFDQFYRTMADQDAS